MDELASEKQIKYMKGLGIEIPEQCTKRQALNLIKYKLEGVRPKDVTNQYSQGANGLAKSAPLPDREKLIIRQSCLKAAVESHVVVPRGLDEKKEFNDEVKHILKIAEEFENWVNRPDGN